jgi:integrase
LRRHYSGPEPKKNGNRISAGGKGVPITPKKTTRTFRHTHAMLLSEVGESLKTAQELLGHSDLETTLAVYTHTVPETQRRDVARVAGVLFSDVLNSASSQKLSERVN